MIRSAIVAIAFLVAAVAAAWPASEKSQAFVMEATAASAFEVESSLLALRMSKDPEIKKFADMMVSDHGKLRSELQMYARKHGLDLSGELDAEGSNALSRLQGEEPIEAPYIDSQRQGNERMVKLFEDYAENGDDPELQNLAVKTLPTLRSHVQQIDEIGTRVGSTR
jgi:putative membrane protein